MAGTLGVRMSYSKALLYLWNQCDQIKDEELRAGCEVFLEDAAFNSCTGSSSVGSHPHHCYPGGLVIHTAEVLRGALALGEVYGADLDVLRVAAIWHDMHKTLEYEVQEGGYVTKKEYASRIGHPVGAATQFAHEHGYEGPNEQRGNIHHCSLSHHGRREWGAPVEPATVEAQILHYADMMSMQYGPGKYEEAK